MQSRRPIINKYELIATLAVTIGAGTYAAIKDGEWPVPAAPRGHGTRRPARAAAHADDESHGDCDDGRGWQSDDPVADDAGRK